MPDRYAGYFELAKSERPGDDFRVRRRDRHSAIAVLAPHGGGIEPGTSELAQAIAGREHSFYAFEGMKPTGNGVLHLTSTRFDEPACLALVGASAIAIAIHGMEGEEPTVHVGGRDDAGVERVASCLRRREFDVLTDSPSGLLGRDPSNICNRTLRRAGIQLELSLGLRRTMFRSLSRSGRRVVTRRFSDFVAAVREALTEAALDRRA